MAKKGTYQEDLPVTINQLQNDKQELLTALEIAYEQLETLEHSGDSMYYIETTLYKFDTEDAA